MNLAQRVAVSLLSLSFLTSGSVKAGEYEDHTGLIETLESHGVEVVLNDADLCDPENETSGLYSPRHNILIVCQDNRFTISGKEVEWSENDYDTLRHEATHVLQDCMSGIDNKDMEKLFDTHDHGEFVRGVLTIKSINKIIEVYTESGASREEIAMELEAFAVALSISPEEISEQLDIVCKG
jgi:hypothetical protein